MLLAAAHLMIEGSFTLGDFALLVGVVQAGYIAYFPTLLGEQIANLQRSRVSFRRMAELVDEDAACKISCETSRSDCGGRSTKCLAS